ncbi:hypothetical protein SNE40_014558 [Patella caerulea]|uniref:UDP-galactose translocator n=1 Tax=Patella caerulea TaxID=87958 RepID=A0AAN8JI94_PATCE
MFVSSTAVVMSEMCKFFTCVVIITVQEGGFKNFLSVVKKDIIDEPWDCVKVCVPSIVYIVQNNLLFLAVSNLDAATFQVTYQLKILTTAIFSVFMLKRELAKLQWVSLLVLFAGVSIVQLQTDNNTKTPTVGVTQNPFTGLVAVIISCVLSGFAGVYFEKILKGTRQSVWIRNIQLSVFGVIVGLFTMEIKDGTIVHEKGFYFGYTWLVCLVIALQSFGGLVVAVVVKYADNILKGFSTSASIVLSCVASIYLFNFQLTLQFTVGALFVMLAVYMYSKFVPVPKDKPLTF